MLCDNCKKNEATIHIKEVHDGKVVASNLCADCAREKEEKKPIKEFAPLDGKPLYIIDGRYGAYLRWGDKNCPLSKEEKADPASVSEERAKEIAISTPEKKRTFRRRTSSRG